MKSITLSEASSDMEALLQSAQKERVVLMRKGKPSAVLVGVESYDEEDLAFAASADFWQMIESRRKDRLIPLATLKARLKADSSPKAKSKEPKRKKRN